ncbi:hypothetical protein RintRC_1187 [Richelia intracellularis]|nr:hypothetical protein RintRC_1187 [Richelia intracellularis]
MRLPWNYNEESIIEFLGALLNQGMISLNFQRFLNGFKC